MYGQPQPGGQPPAYGMQQQQQQQQQVVVVQQQQAAIRPASYLALAVVVCICCNAVCGLVAIIFSVMSSSAADSGDLASARSRGKVSLGFSIGGIITSILSIIVIVVYFVVLVNEVADTTLNVWNNYADNCYDTSSLYNTC